MRDGSTKWLIALFAAVLFTGAVIAVLLLAVIQSGKKPPPASKPAAVRPQIAEWTPEERVIIDHFLRAPPVVELKTGSVGRLPVGYVQQVVDGRTFLVEGHNGQGHTLMVSGIDTSDMFDGQRWQPESLFICSGPTRFVTVGGSTRTVMRVEPISGRELEAAALLWAEHKRAENLKKAGMGK